MLYESLTILFCHVSECLKLLKKKKCLVRPLLHGDTVTQTLLKGNKKSRHTSVLRLMEGVCSASFWRIASTADTGAGPAVWGVLPAYR